MTFILNNKNAETENKTIRFPLELINRIEDELQNNNVTFSRFVIQACEYALENMEKKDNTKKYWVEFVHLYSAF